MYSALSLCRTIKKNRDDYIKRLNDIYKNNLDKDHVEHIVGHAQFTGPKDVVVGDRAITAKHILIATGTKPILPNVPGEINLPLSLKVVSPVWYIVVCLLKLMIVVESCLKVLSLALPVMDSLNWRTYPSKSVNHVHMTE